MRSMSVSALAMALVFLPYFLASSADESAPFMNQAPVVSLSGGGGPALVPPNTTKTLTAVVTDDGLPAPSSVSYHWCKEFGPGPVKFGTPHALVTTATFDVAGVYTIRFTADDGEKKTMKTLTVTLNQPANLPIAVQGILAAEQTPSSDPMFVDRFLTLVPNSYPFNTTGAAYYAQVDPLNQRLTFDAWKTANGFTPGAQPLVAVIEDGAVGCCSAGIYGNAGDLGFGRRMVMNRVGDNVSYYVTNYDTVDTAIAEDPTRIILTVCMEYSPTPGYGSGAPYIKFFMYDGMGNRITDVNFDGRGPKPVPASCNACHGGSYAPGGGIPPGGDMGAIYLPFDIDNFDFSCATGFEKEAQEQAFKEMNEAILHTNPPVAIREIIEGWYGGFGLPDDNQNIHYVPPGWASEPELYRQVVAKSCRMCHLARTSAVLDFNASSDFAAAQTSISGSTLFGPSPSGFRMPHAERAFMRFWLSTTPHQPAVLASAFQNGVFVGLGAPPGRVFVDAAAAGANNGSSWTDAYTSLSSALTAAAAPGANIAEIWVAGGTYRPSTAGLGDSRAATFTIPSGVRVHGGFASGMALIEDRDLAANETILSGDLLGDDNSGGDNSENCYHVVTLSQAAMATKLDGFTILGGNATGAPDARGGGIYINGGSPALSRLQIERNVAPQGGGILALSTGARLSNVGLYGNDGMVLGGGILALAGSNLELTNVVLSFNLAEDPGGFGGGIFADASQLLIRNTNFYRNYSDVMGAGLQLSNGAQVDVMNSIFWHNCTSGVVNEDAQILLDNAMAPVALDLDYSIVEGLTGLLGGVGNLSSDPSFINPNGVDGIIGTRDDDMRIQEGSPAIDAGSNDLVGLDSFDLDDDTYLGEVLSQDFLGQKRFFDSNATADTGVGSAPIVDIGAVERNDGSLLDLAAGNIRIGVDGPHDVVRINGSSGGSPRLVYLATGQNLTISIDQPPSQPFAPFTLFLNFGVPGPNDVTTIDFGIGDMVIRPAPLQPFNNGDFVLADSLGLGFPAAAFATIAPWSITVPLGPVEGDFVVQGLVWDDTKPIPISVTNAVLVSVRDNPPVNFEPVAQVPNTNFQAFTGANVQLDGSTSFDPEGEALTYSWVQTGGAAVTLNNATSAIADFNAPMAPDVFTFELTVNDGVQDSSPLVVTVTTVSDTPIANAGPNQSVLAGALVTLDGSASADPQGTPLGYQWTQLSGTPVTLNGATTVSPTFTAPASSGSLVFRLIVNDGVNFSTADTVTITVLTSFASDVHPIFSARGCTGCHTGGGAPAGLNFNQAAGSVYPLIVPGRVNLGNPSQSLLLLKPLSTSAGGVAHGGGNIFANTSDPDYVTILNWISEGALNN